jgi:guanine deaminase
MLSSLSHEPSLIHALFQLAPIGNSIFQNCRFTAFWAYTCSALCPGKIKMSNSFMARAIQLSLENVRSACGGPFGAVVVRNGQIVAEGVNQVTSRNDPTAHAEILAIRQACANLGVFELKDCDLYSSCEPCPMCLGAIYWSRLARVYYANTASDAAKIGFDDSFIYGELNVPHAQRCIPAIQIMREEALAAFRAWTEKPDKIRY